MEKTMQVLYDIWGGMGEKAGFSQDFCIWIG
jgi:hypothetical protein